MEIMSEQLLESIEVIDFAKQVYATFKNFAKVSFETFFKGIKSIGSLGISILKFVIGYDFSNLQYDLKWLLKQFARVKNLNESPIFDIISNILSSKIFWIVVFLFLMSNVFGAISTMISAKAVLAGTAAVTGGEIAGVVTVANAASIASSAAVSAFVNAGLSAGAVVMAWTR